MALWRPAGGQIPTPGSRAGLCALQDLASHPAPRVSTSAFLHWLTSNWRQLWL